MKHYGWDRQVEYNVFGADQHIVVSLYCYEGQWKKVRKWSFPAYFFPALAERRAEKVIARLQKTYKAIPL